MEQTRRIDSGRYKKLKPRFSRVSMPVYGSVRRARRKGQFAMYLADLGLFARIRLSAVQANSIHISESFVIMHILLYFCPPVCKPCLYATPRRRPQPICPCIAQAVYHPQCGGHDNCAGVDGDNCDFGGNISTLLVLLCVIDVSYGNLPGSFFGLKCLRADDVGYAECCGDKGATRYLFLP